MLHCSWDMVHEGCNYFSFWDFFCPFTSLTAQKIKIKKKWKNNLEISWFYKWVPKIMIRWCTVPEIWCMRDVSYFSFRAIFFPFTPLTAQKIKILKKCKKPLKISSFYMCVPKLMIRWCTVIEIWCMTDLIIFHFGLFFALLLP